MHNWSGTTEPCRRQQAYTSLLELPPSTCCLVHKDRYTLKQPDTHIRHVDVPVQIYHILALWMDLDQDLVLPHDLPCQCITSISC